MILVYDLETSGFTNSRLLELGLLLLDEHNGWRTVMELSIIVKPDGWKIEQGAIDVHGITQEHAETVGLPLEMALSLFTKFRQLASLVVCHNLSHDYRIMDGELGRMKWPRLGDTESKFFCTMLSTVDICRIPNTNGKRGFKWPKLVEAYRHFFHKDFPNAHTALGDARPTAEIFRELVRLGLVPNFQAPLEQAPYVNLDIIQKARAKLLALSGWAAVPPPPPPITSVAHAFPAPPPPPQSAFDNPF